MPRHAVALAPAKVNLGLEVLGRRPDGYHDVATILQTVSIYDRFEWFRIGGSFDYESATGIDPATDFVTVALDTADDKHLWTGRLRLHKHIPVSAGLGGGSADAALALQIARPNASSGELIQRAANLGSDIPFFLTGGTASATGTGTTIAPLPTSDLWFVIVTPPLRVPSKTATLYGALRDEDFSDGTKVSALAQKITNAQLITNSPPNAFERHLRSYSPVQQAWNALERAGAPWVSVSGAGPSIFTAVSTYQQATAVSKRVSNDVGIVNVARSLPAVDRDVAAENLALCLRGGIPSR